jgi:hypothetical protein
MTPAQESDADALARRAAEAGISWCPQAGSQVIFLASPFFETLYEGTRGPGKTDALLMDFAQYCGRGYAEAWRGILFRQTFPQLGDVIAKSKKWFNSTQFAKGKPQYNEAKSQWEWPTGEVLLLRHFLRDDDYWNFHGHEYPWVGWEELCNWPSLTGYKRMMSCCRSSKPGLPRHYRATTNPYGPGHNLVKTRFRLPSHRFTPILDAKDEHGELEPPRFAVFGHINENKILLEADPDYISRIRAAARNTAEFDAWLHGSWDIVAGGMFDDLWQTKHHVVEPFDIPGSWYINRSFDWGSSSPFSVGWWAESDGTDIKLPNGRWRSTVPGDLYRIGEWYGCRPGAPNEGLRMLATDIAKGIREREEAVGLAGLVKDGPADTSIFNAENGVCIATDMAQPVLIGNGRYAPGVTWARADKNPHSRKTGWEKMRQYLAGALPSAAGPREKPGLFFFSNCKDAINLIPVTPRDEKKLDDVDTESEDHIADEIRYRVRAAGMRMKQSQAVGAF